MKKFFLYARKSTEAEDKQILSIESQKNELITMAEKRGLAIADVLRESKSAKAPGREIFNEMMTRIAQGEAQGILCWKLDRLARNPIDGGALIWAIKEHKIEIVTPHQIFGPDNDNSMLLYVEFGVAQKFIDDLTRNVKRGLKAKVEAGWYPVLAPLGYLNRKELNQGQRDYGAQLNSQVVLR